MRAYANRFSPRIIQMMMSGMLFWGCSQQGMEQEAKLELVQMQKRHRACRLDPQGSI